MAERESSQPSQEQSNLIKRKKIEAIKTGTGMATIITGAGLMSFAPAHTPAQYVGGAIFVGTFLYPIAEITLNKIKTLKE